MLKKIFLGLIVVIMLAAVIVALQPSEFRVVRTHDIAAPPEVVFAQVNDFHRWQAWSPWVKLDPAATVTFGGPASGEGAKFAWDGNDEIGSGRMAIISSIEPTLIEIELEFIKPFEGHSSVEFGFAPVAGRSDATQVTWTMIGQKNFISKAVFMFVDCNKLLGGDFEQGLAALDTAAQAARETPAATQAAEGTSAAEATEPADPAAESEAAP